MIYLIFLVSLFNFSFSAEVILEEIRYWTAPEYTRVVFDLSSPQVEYEITESAQPAQINVYLKNVHSQMKTSSVEVKNDRVIKNIKIFPQEKGVKISLSLFNRTKFKTFFLKKYGQKSNRLIIDCQYLGPVERISEEKLAEIKKIKKIIMIDPGHGGEDPGTIGRYKKIREKDIVLKIAQELKKIINQHPVLKAFLTRRGDYFVSLRERTKLAHLYQADVFISIHVNYSRKPEKKGTHIYTLSLKGATDKSAKLLADLENAADLIGGVEEKANDTLIKVLLDLSQTDTLNKSLSLAQKIKKEFCQFRPDQEVEVRKANFVVLRSIKVPSVLIEVGFISHLGEEDLLAKDSVQRNIAATLYNSLLSFLDLEGKIKTGKFIPPHFFYYQVRKGDTLWGIARRYGLAVSYLKKINQLTRRYLYPGQKLLIATPQSSFSPRVYVVKKGDTLWEIARTFRVSLKEIKKINKLKPGKPLLVGQKLHIP